MTDITSDGIQLPSFDLSTKSPDSDDHGRVFYHNGNGTISLTSGITTNRAGIYIWNYGMSAWGTFPDSEVEFSEHAPEDFLFSSALASPGGVASLDSNGELPDSQVPSVAISNTDVVANKTERLALAAETGDVAIQNDENQSYILKGTDPSLDSEWKILKSPTDAVDSVFGRTGAVTQETGDYTHSQITGQSSSDHHTRYSNQEARNAVSGASLSGGLSLGSDLNVSTSIFENLERVATRTWTNSNADVPNADYADSAGNADTLDGEHAGAFANSGHNHDSRYDDYSYWTIEEGDGEQTNIYSGQKLEIYGGTDINTEVVSTGGETRLRVAHNNTSGQGDVTTGGATVIDDIYLDGQGHVTNLNTQNRSLDDWGTPTSTVFFDRNGIQSTDTWMEIDGNGAGLLFNYKNQNEESRFYGPVDIRAGISMDSSDWSDYEIQKNGTDANGVINFKT